MPPVKTKKARNREAEDVPGCEGRWGQHRTAAPASGLPRSPSQGPCALFGAIRGGRLTRGGGRAGPGFRQLPRSLYPQAALCPAPSNGFYSVRKAKTRKERGGWGLTRHHRHGVSPPCRPALSDVTMRQAGRGPAGPTDTRKIPAEVFAVRDCVTAASTSSP